MKVLITNLAVLNTGDAAILLGTLDILRRTFGAPLDVTACDQQPAAVGRLYPELDIRPTLFGAAEQWSAGALRRKVGLLLVLASAFLRRVPFFGAAPGRLLPRPLAEALDTLAAADLVVSAGGTYLVPHYRIGPKLVDLLVAGALGRPYVLFTQSLGPFPRQRGRGLLRFVLRRARLILVRDTLSRRHLLDLGIPAERVVECADAAFALSAQPFRGVSKPRANRLLRIAVSVRDWPHFRKGPGMGAYLDSVAALTGHLVTRHEAEVTFLSTCQGVGDYWTDDSALAEALASRLTPEVRHHVVVDRDFHEPRQLMALLAGFDAVVATRMHVAILALSAGVPVLPIAYEFKTTELFARLGLGRFVQDIESVTPESLCGAFDRLIEARGEVAAALPALVARERASAFGAGTHLKQALGVAS